MDGQTGMTKLTVTFGTSANTPKKVKYQHIPHTSESHTKPFNVRMS